MKLHFTSRNPAFLSEIKTLFPDATVNTDIKTIDRKGRVFISPANSIGFMDGGIDLVLSTTMFPGIQRDVQRKIQEIGLKTNIGRSYLRIGSALIIPIGETAMISAPTMFLPHNVSETNNAYHAFLASLALFKKYRDYIDHNVHTLVATSLCCGYGGMDEKVSANQMKNAYNDFVSGNFPDDTSRDPTVVLFPSVDEQQPNIYDNREIKDIYAHLGIKNT